MSPDTEALLEACDRGNVQLVSELLAKGDIDVNAMDGDGWSPLYTACIHGLVDMVELLLRDERVNPNLENAHRKYTAMHSVCHNGHSDLVRLLLQDRRLDPNTPTDREIRPLHLAVYRGKMASLYLLLRDRRVDLNARDEAGCTPLHAACKVSRKNPVTRLLLDDWRVKPNLVNADGRTPLAEAFHRRAYDTIKLLLASGRLINTQLRGDLIATGPGKQQCDSSILTLLEAYRQRPQRTCRQLRMFKPNCPSIHSTL